jgi:O-antigen/teichoic acid export membrane protein
VYLLLGDKWLFIISLVQIMALGNLVGAFAHSCGYALLALGKVKIQAYIIWLQAILFILTALVFGGDASAENFATIRLAVVLIGSVLLIAAVLFQLRIMNLFEFSLPLVRPLLAASLMWLLLHNLHIYLTELTNLMRLAIEVLVGATVYFSAIIAMWLLVKKPEGAESYLLKNILSLSR